MRSQNSISTLRVTPMNRDQAAMLVKRLMGAYPSISLHDPEVYIAELVAVFTQYAIEVAERAIEQAKLESPSRVPTVPQIKAACQEQRRDHAFTYAMEYERRSQQQLQDWREIERENEREPLEHRRQVAARILGEYHGSKPDGQKPIETPAAVMAKYGLTQEQWDALPDAQPDKWRKLCATHAKAAE